MKTTVAKRPPSPTVALTINLDVPAAEVLRARAAEHKLSLEDYILGMLERAAGFPGVPDQSTIEKRLNFSRRSQASLPVREGGPVEIDDDRGSMNERDGYL